MGEKLRGKDDDGAWFDADEFGACEVAKRPVGGHAGRADGLAEALLPLRQRDSSPMGGGGVDDPGCRAGGGVVQLGADTFGLVVAYLRGKVGEDVAAYGRNVVEERQELLAGDPAEPGRAACLPGGGVATTVEYGRLVDRAGCGEVAEGDAAAVCAVMEGRHHTRLDDQEVRRGLAADGDHGPAGNCSNG